MVGVSLLSRSERRLFLPSTENFLVAIICGTAIALHGSARLVFTELNLHNQHLSSLEDKNMLGTILLIVLVLLLLGAVPAWPHSRNWGYGPSGGLGLVVIIILVLLLMGRI